MSAGPSSHPLQLRVLTYNVFCFPHWREMCKLIEQLDADIVCLQEVLVSVLGDEKRNQTALLANRLGYHWVCNPNWPRPFCVRGNSILSRRPAQTEILKDSEGYPFAIAAAFEDTSWPFCLVAGHLQWLHHPLPIGVFTSYFRRSAQIRQMLKWVSRRKRPFLLAGDFNSMAHGPEHAILSRHAIDCTRAVPVKSHCTRRTWGLPIQLDYVFASPPFRTRACQILEVDFSDHHPVVVDLELGQP
jgi:endonuclease/exonuclease/phosphatase family metal-dependent hydrolase